MLTIYYHAKGCVDRFLDVDTPSLTSGDLIFALNLYTREVLSTFLVTSHLFHPIFVQKNNSLIKSHSSMTMLRFSNNIL